MFTTMLVNTRIGLENPDTISEKFDIHSLLPEHFVITRTWVWALLKLHDGKILFSKAMLKYGKIRRTL